MYINLGTLLPSTQTVPATARACAAAGKPWVLDPVGVGIGSLRTRLIEAVRENPPTILRGNASRSSPWPSCGAWRQLGRWRLATAPRRR